MFSVSNENMSGRIFFVICIDNAGTIFTCDATVHPCFLHQQKIPQSVLHPQKIKFLVLSHFYGFNQGLFFEFPSPVYWIQIFRIPRIASFAHVYSFQMLREEFC